MNIETLERANRLKNSIDHYKWQLKYIDDLRKSSVKVVISTESGCCNTVEIPNETAKEIILASLCSVYSDFLEKAENELDSI